MENLGHAARSFMAALLAMDPAKANPSSRMTEEDIVASHDELDQLARKFDAIMPNQAAELRYLLSRD
jgi:hypothetical protein